MEIEEIIQKLYDHYEVDSNIDLANKMSLAKQTITNWKSRNSVKAIKKKCRELGIYDDIFNDNNESNTSLKFEEIYTNLEILANAKENGFKELREKLNIIMTHSLDELFDALEASEYLDYISSLDSNDINNDNFSDEYEDYLRKEERRDKALLSKKEFLTKYSKLHDNNEE